MLEQKTIVDRIEILSDGTMLVQLGLVFLQDGTEIDRRLHGMQLAPGEDFAGTVSAVNADLARLHRAQFSDTVYLKSIADVVHTPDVIAAFEAKMEAALAAAEAKQPVT